MLANTITRLIMLALFASLSVSSASAGESYDYREMIKAYLAETDEDKARELINRIAEFDECISPILSELLKSADAESFLKLGKLIECAQISSLATDIIPHATSDNSVFRRKAAELLGRCEDRRVAMILLDRILNDPEEDVHVSAFFALFQLKENAKDCLPELIAIFLDEANSTKWYRTSWLSQDTRSGLALQAICAIGMPARPFLKRCCTDSSLPISNRKDALHAIGRMCHRWPHQYYLDEVALCLVDDVIPLLDSKEELLVHAAAEALGDVGDSAKHASPKLEKLLKKSKDDDRLFFLENLMKVNPNSEVALLVLREDLKLKDEKLAMKLMNIISKTCHQTDGVLELITPYLRSEDEYIRRDAIGIVRDSKKIGISTLDEIERMAKSDSSKMVRDQARWLLEGRKR